MLVRWQVERAARALGLLKLMVLVRASLGEQVHHSQLVSSSRFRCCATQKKFGYGSEVSVERTTEGGHVQERRGDEEREGEGVEGEEREIIMGNN